MVKGGMEKGGEGERKRKTEDKINCKMFLAKETEEDTRHAFY